MVTSIINGVSIEWRLKGRVVATCMKNGVSTEWMFEKCLIVSYLEKMPSLLCFLIENMNS